MNGSLNQVFGLGIGLCIPPMQFSFKAAQSKEGSFKSSMPKLTSLHPLNLLSSLCPSKTVFSSIGYKESWVGGINNPIFLSLAVPCSTCFFQFPTTANLAKIQTDGKSLESNGLRCQGKSFYMCYKYIKITYNELFL